MVTFVAVFDGNSIRNVQASFGSSDVTKKTEEFDPGSERTLAAWLRHASRTELLE